MLAYNENDGVEFPVALFDATHLASLPQTVHYRLECETTGKKIIPDTQIVPTVTLNSSGVSEVTVLVEIPGSANVIQNRNNTREVKALWVTADLGLRSQKSQDYKYLIRNTQGR